MTEPSPVRLVLASASPARLATLRAAGLHPEVVVSGVDESGVEAGTVSALTGRLAALKAEAVAAALPERAGTTVVLGCDSLLELDGAERIRIADTLGKHFDYGDLMAGLS